MRETTCVKSDEIRHDVQSTRAKLSELIHEPDLRGHEDVAQTLADLEVDLARIEAEVDRALPNDGMDEMLRLDIAELKDIPSRADPALERQLQRVAASAIYIERRMKVLESEHAAALHRGARRRAGVRALLGVVLAVAPFLLGYARKKPLLASAQVLVGSAAAASALLVETSGGRGRGSRSPDRTFLKRGDHRGVPGPTGPPFATRSARAPSRRSRP